MLGFRKSNSAFGNVLKRLDGAGFLKQFRSAAHARARSFSGSDDRLVETEKFGLNPGQLRMFSYMPARPIGQLPIVVVLHGCGQTAAEYDHGAGWSTLADRYGFALLVPQQQRSNNANGCFNWFQPEDARRGSGEAASIHQMVQAMARDHGIDPRRVFITGLSAGGAMTSVMLACYPETFAAGAIIAGLPYGAASNVQQAFQSMFQCPQRTAKDWGDRVRAAAGRHKGSWPRVSVWHGGADKTVIPPNAQEIVKQWTDVHGLAVTPSKEDRVSGFSRQAWFNDVGEELVESYVIPNMSHGTPLSPGDGAVECGAAGPFLLDVGISSTFHIARFFGLTLQGARQLDAASGTSYPEAKQQPLQIQGERLHGEAREDGPAQHPRKESPSPRMDIGAVISRALEQAGLKSRG
jgi:poly(hydroxyalkanoate) depolymerase family esterase